MIQQKLCRDQLHLIIMRNIDRPIQMTSTNTQEKEKDDDNSSSSSLNYLESLQLRKHCGEFETAVLDKPSLVMKRTCSSLLFFLLFLSQPHLQSLSKKIVDKKQIQTVSFILFICHKTRIKMLEFSNKKRKIDCIKFLKTNNLCLDL